MSQNKIRAAWPNMQFVVAATVDINGIWRGKTLPVSNIDKLMVDGVKMPASIHAVNIWGEDPEKSAMVYEHGDADCIFLPTDFKPFTCEWMEAPMAFVPLWSFNDGKTPFLGDPRQVLAHMLEKYKARSIRPVIAFELEFYIVKKSTIPPQKYKATPQSGFGNALSIDELATLNAIWEELYTICKNCGVELDTLTAESGGSQFEVSFKHKDNPLRAADEIMMFRMILCGVLGRHGLDASFMAKTYADESGSGLHLHMSWLDEAGNNIFNDGGDEGTNELRYAVGGLLETMSDFTLIFAPGLNSFRRLAPNSHAPTHINWGYDHRMVAVRIPASAPEARRIEHRVAGSDANPYLVLAAILGGAMHGIEHKITPPAPLELTSETDPSDSLPRSWEEAIEVFANGTHTRKIFPEILIQMINDQKTSEIEKFRSIISDFEYQSYMGI